MTAPQLLSAALELLHDHVEFNECALKIRRCDYHRRRNELADRDREILREARTLRTAQMKRRGG